MLKLTPFSSVCLLALLSASTPAAVDLVTVPSREGVQLTIYNS